MEEKNETEKDKKLAVLCHLSGLVGWWVVPFIGNALMPLVIWGIWKKERPVLRKQGREAFNFQVSLLLYSLVGVMLWAITFFSLAIFFTSVAGGDAEAQKGLMILCIFAFLLVTGVNLFGILTFDVIFVALAAMRIAGGRDWRYPLTIRFLKDKNVKLGKESACAI